MGLGQIRKFSFNPLEPGCGTDNIPPLMEIGGKAYGLYWLAAHGFPCPQTWVLSTTLFDLAVQNAGLEATIAEIWRNILETENDWAAVQRMLDRLEYQRLRVVELLANVTSFGRVSLALADLPIEPRYWAVRSSATVEDDPRYSFAGQFLSLLAVPTGPQLWNAVRKVWASAFNRQVLAYCAQRDTPLPRMAVIMQPMTAIGPQDRSGVIFSHSPVPTMPGVLIQTAFGTGQTVVGGRGGDLYSIHDGKVSLQPVPTEQIFVTSHNGDVKMAWPPQGHPLTDAEALQLADLVSKVAETWDGAVNVEFVWRVNEPPLLVQVRSTTT